MPRPALDKNEQQTVIAKGNNHLHRMKGNGQLLTVCRGKRRRTQVRVAYEHELREVRRCPVCFKDEKTS